MSFRVCFPISPIGNVAGQRRSIGRHGPALRRSQKLADPKHHVQRIAAPLADAPLVQLFGEIGRRLTGKGGVGGSQPLSAAAMTGCAGDDPSVGVAVVIEPQRRQCAGRRFEGHGSVVSRDGVSFIRLEVFRDPAHLRMVPAAILVSSQLRFDVASLQPGEARRPRTIPLPLKPVTGVAGVGGTGSRAAQRDQLASLPEAIDRRRLGLRAARKYGCGSEGQEFAGARHVRATTAPLARFPRAAAFGLMLLSSACKPPPEQGHPMPIANASAGKAAIERVGCGSCHTIPGIAWPQGKMGPDLGGLPRRGLIAGKLPNQPDTLAAFIRNAPAYVPDSGMPAMPVSKQESRDIAAYLYQQGEP